ncbi:hypothetical protein [Streptomyces sp. MNP-20]|uniref:hypothetical protein n=1 Tax=Streptomyces sp. MNP-20 TaxID=2721165 RepID=UPI0020A6AF0B|nr:hypothetical protein [Streptomyces sp. MNP-20]
MTEFADEARSRAARLLRMANTRNPQLREQILHYAESTPDPPLMMGTLGIRTKGCPKCRSTMWQQRDGDGPYWVCASCGTTEEVRVECPECRVPMKPPAKGSPDRWRCPRCKRVAATNDTPDVIDNRERQRTSAIALLDQAIAARAH